MSQSTSGPPVSPHLCTCPTRLLGISFSLCTCQQVWFSMVSQPLCHLPLMRGSLSLPLSLVCSPQALPAPQPLAVSPCTGPHRTEPHEVESNQYFDARKVKQVTVRPLEEYLTYCLPQKFGLNTFIPST